MFRLLHPSNYSAESGMSIGNFNNYIMEKNKKNEELQSRREFFKSAAKGALPILGAIVLAGTPSLVKAIEIENAPMGCRYGCSGSCYTSCAGTCKGTCNTTCMGSCVGSCRGTCDSCKGSCQGTCEITCRGTCQGSCQNSCQGLNY